MTRPIAITCGDPQGIGAEVVVRALAEGDHLVQVVRPLLVGPQELFARAARLIGSQVVLKRWEPGVEISLVRPGEPHETFFVLEPTGQGPIELLAIEAAADLCLRGEAAALATAPIHKASLIEAGFPHPGHTEYLAALCGRPTEDAVMLFAGGRLCVALLTTHLPLSSVPEAITQERIIKVTRAVWTALRRDFGVATPRLGLCGLNPHAGESGRLGTEEELVMKPSAAALRREGINISPPLPADTLFSQALGGHYDAVIAAYHDQGLAPLKAVDFGRSVNTTVGLPIIRTSVDHGTARDIAWTGRARASSMAAAIDLAVQIATQRGLL